MWHRRKGEGGERCAAPQYAVNLPPRHCRHKLRLSFSLRKSSPLRCAFFRGGLFFVVQPWLVCCGFSFVPWWLLLRSTALAYALCFFFFSWLFLSTPSRSCRGGTSFAQSGKGCKALFGPSRRSAVAVNFSASSFA